jgi:hypothetical protein
MTEPLDLDLLAYDIADMVSRNEYPLDVSEADIRSALPAFIEQVRKNAAASGE